MRGRTADDACRWLNLEPPERRRLAEQACRERDAETLWSLTEAFLEHERDSDGHLSSATRRSYRWSIDVLLDHWSGDILLHPSQDDAVRFVQHLQESGMSASTVKVHLVGARMFYRALRWAEASESDPFRDVRPTREAVPREKRQMYTRADLDRLLALAEPVDRAVVLLSADAGLRVSESVRLTWGDVDLDRGEVTIRDEVSTLSRVVPLPSHLRDTLRELPRDRGPHILGFTSEVWARRRLQHLCERAGVPYRGIDPLRQAGNVRRSEQARVAPARDQSVQFLADSRAHDKDVLSDIPDGEALLTELARALAEAERISSPSALLMIRLERLAETIARHNPETGRAVLRAIAARLDRARRPYDFLAQTDDETFALVLRHIPSSAALSSVADRLSSLLRSHPITVHGAEFTVTPTVGTSMGAQEPDGLLREAVESLERR